MESGVRWNAFEVRRFMGYTPHQETSGLADIESMALYAGQGVGLVNEVQPAADIVREIGAEAKALMDAKVSARREDRHKG